MRVCTLQSRRAGQPEHTHAPAHLALSLESLGAPHPRLIGGLVDGLVDELLDGGIAFDRTEWSRLASIAQEVLERFLGSLRSGVESAAGSETDGESDHATDKDTDANAATNANTRAC